MMEELLLVSRARIGEPEYEEKKGIFERNIKKRHRRFKAIAMIYVDWEKVASLLADWL
jgi:hypothetical protein